MTKQKIDHKKLAIKWQAEWKKNKTYTPDIENTSAQNKFYNLMMFPYPSAEGLHVGNMYAFTGTDIHGRFQRMNGKHVFEPIGLDGFGIHSENYAIKVGRHPKEHAEISQKNFYSQLSKIGNGFDWDHKLETYDPDYYRWTQWLFIQMFKAGLAYKASASVNWCPKDKTVLADEQVENGKCERCGAEVERKEMSSWFFKITDYADNLLENLDKIDWPKKIKTAQSQWIGKKQGIEIEYLVEGTNKKINVFTTRPDTNFGATFIVVAPEYAKEYLLDNISKNYAQDVQVYIDESLSKSEQQRKVEEKKKTGVFTGLYAVNNLNGYKMPIWVADYVLMGYGTGAVVGVPGHDKRDFEFAKKYDLEIKQVVRLDNPEILRSYLMGAESISDEDLTSLGIKIHETTDSGSRKVEIPKKSYAKYQNLVREKLSKGFWNEVVGEEVWFLFKDKKGNNKEFILNNDNQQEIAEMCSEFNNDPIEKTSNQFAYLASNDWYEPYLIQEGEGTMVNSEFLNGLDIHEATEKMIDYLEDKDWGKRKTSYHLRDWGISRQRYWGPPIPMINCSKCGWQPVPEDQLPVVLPDIKDFKPKGDGTSPLANAPDDWKNTSCPKCGAQAERELDVSDTFLDSSWYFLAYPNLHTKEWKEGPTPFNENVLKTWFPVDAYIGGAEHAVLHLLYARFVWMVLHDQKILPKELGDEPFPFLFSHGLIIKDGTKMSKSKGNVINPDEYIEKYGADAFRTYLMFLGPYESGGDFRDSGVEGMSRFQNKIWELLTQYNDVILVEETDSRKLYTKLHQTIKKVTNDIKGFHYNTAISAIMELTNLMRELKTGNIKTANGGIRCAEWDESLKSLVQLIAPFMPFMAEEAWVELLGQDGSVHNSQWPKYREELIVEDVVKVVVQVNGKVRATLELEAQKAADEAYVISKALDNKNITKWIAKEEDIKRKIFVPGKILNLVV